MDTTSQEYDKVISICRTLFVNKMKDYGSAWRILRLPSLTDQIYIKAQRIRSLQENEVRKVDEGEAGEFIGIINYSIMALIQLELDVVEQPDLDLEKATQLYDTKIKETKEEQDTLNGFKRVFINAKIVEEEGDDWAFNEGCLSIPDVREDVFRKPNITVEYLDENFKSHKESFDGLIARVVQHEYDHIEGVLFTDKLSSLKKRLIKGRLTSISKGKIDVDYRMRFPNQKKRR